jgi:hemerythrin superfamily protein
VRPALSVDVAESQHRAAPCAHANREEKRMAGIDAIRMLKDDHQTVEALFKRFEKAGDRAHVEKREIVDRIIEALSVHASIEEQLFYPVARATVSGTEDIALESLEEHHIVKWVLSELDSMTPEDERFDAKVTVLIENVRHHVKEEEEEFFPMMRGELGRNALGELGAAMAEAKQTAPTRPHPRSPDSPPANLVTGTAAGVADRLGDTMTGLAQGYVTAVGDLVALMLGRKKPRVSPTGSKVTRDTATRVRSGASDATGAVMETARRTVHGGERALHVAATTGSSATAGAQRTVRTAKSGATTTTRAAKAGVKGAVGSTHVSTRPSSQRAVATAKRAATATARTAGTATKNTATVAQRSTRKTSSTTKRTAAAR